MATYYQQAQPVSPQRVYLLTSVGPIPHNPTTANAGTAVGSSGVGDTQFAPTGCTNILGARRVQQPMSQYYPSSASYNPGPGNAMQAKSSIPQAFTRTQPVAVAPMMTTSTGTGFGTTAGMLGGLSGGTGVGVIDSTVIDARRAANVAEEEAEVGAGIGTCWGCCGPAAGPGGSAELSAGGSIGPDTAATPPGPADPASERIVQYFKSGYNSAAAGANAKNGLPGGFAGVQTRGTVPMA